MRYSTQVFGKLEMFDASALAREMPLLTKLNGVFVGEYIHQDPQGHEFDRHNVHMHTWVDEAGRHQVNTYTWQDGREEVHRFDSGYEGDAIIRFDDDRMKGECWEADNQTVLLTWRRTDLPDTYFYEMAQLSLDGTKRTRIWHVFENDRLVRRVLINEERQQIENA